VLDDAGIAYIKSPMVGPFYRSPSPESQSFADVGDTSTCTGDCSGHDAGFEWAKEKEITDSSDCGGKSQSFIEGCEAYAEAVEEGGDE
jgi:hypothetical protein